MTDLKHITFFIDGDLDKFDAVESIVKEEQPRTGAIIEFYLISHELKNSKGQEKPHYHFILLTTEKIYTSIFKRLKLLLKASVTAKGKGGYRPYGRLKEPIRDLHKLSVYCSKDGNVRSTYSQSVLQDLHKQSFKKEAEDNLFEEMVTFMAEHPEHTNNQHCAGIQSSETIDNIRRGIIHFLITKEQKISKPKVEGFLSKYIRNLGCEMSSKVDIFMGLYYKIY